MKALSFEISGRTAIFKKPDVNSYAYFTYNNIHKPALLGILGAIIGLGGYNKLYEKNKGLKKGTLAYDNGFPEYYEKLKHLKVSIIPLAKNGYFSKKIQTFNNSVGYASFEQGGNLVVREQWLENPKWQIIILEDDSEEYKKLKDYLVNQKAVFIPYLGKNDHPANIDKDKVEEIDLTQSMEYDKLDSLFFENKFEISSRAGRNILPFLFKESSPVSLEKELHFYENKTLVFTNQKVQFKDDVQNVYQYDGKSYFFF